MEQYPGLCVFVTLRTSDNYEQTNILCHIISCSRIHFVNYMQLIVPSNYTISVYCLYIIFLQNKHY